LARLDWYVRVGLKPRHLQLLVAIDDLRQLGKVAELMNITQPAVSKTLAELQNGLGLKLFDRTGRGLVPTIYGACLIRHARAILKDLTETAEELHALSAGSEGKVRLGALPAAAASLVPRGLALLKAMAPTATVFVREGTMDVLTQELRAGNLDLFCGTLLVNREGLEIEEKVLLEDRTVAVVGRRHPLVARRKVEWVDLGGFPWVLPPQESLLREPLISAFRQHDVALPSNYIETLSPNVIQNYIHFTDAIAFMSALVAVQYQQRNLLSVLPLELPPLVRPVGVVWAARRQLSKGAKLMMVALEEAAAEMSGVSDAGMNRVHR
jgi:DNA-binding transcriptional LysR family regulator